MHIGDSWLKNHWQNWVIADWEIINTTQFCNWHWNHKLKYFTVGVGIVDENWVTANSEIVNIIYVAANFQIGSGDEVVSGSTSFFQSIVWFMLGFPLPTFLNLFRHRTSTNSLCSSHIINQHKSYFTCSSTKVFLISSFLISTSNIAITCILTFIFVLWQCINTHDNNFTTKRFYSIFITSIATKPCCNLFPFQNESKNINNISVPAHRMFLKFQQSHTISSMRINIISYTFHVSP